MANLFLNYVSEKLIHSNTTADGSRQFVNVSVPIAGSDNGYGSFAVNLGQVLPATKKDGTVVDGMKNILLGAPEKTRKVSVLKGGAYESVEMTHAQIAEAVAESRRAYRAANAEAQA